MQLPRSIYSLENIKRAWGWVKSNPDHVYKSYFRELYSAFSIAEKENLKTLSTRLRRGIYEPSKACKIYFPKSSGILRPYTLMTVEDQIVYQSAVNVVAEKLYPRIKDRYYKEIFGHLYAGKFSSWFYEKWTRGYSAFNKQAKVAYSQGFKFTASFDLTACYDSIDHKVLKHFLRDLKLSEEFAVSFVDLLSAWTATNKNIFHGHGIPQGPLSSGLVSEVVLRHFDESGKRKKGDVVRYFRYVDDIRLYAKDEKHLRITLVELDKISKDIGLFPQSGKISIREIDDINEELHSPSMSVDDELEFSTDNQDELLEQILQITPKYKVQNRTRFKQLLACADPSSKLTTRLWKIIDKAPEFYDPISRYLMRYKQLPSGIVKVILELIEKEKLYQAIPAAFLTVLTGRLRTRDITGVRAKLKPLWDTSDVQDDYLGRLACMLISINGLTERNLQNVLTKNKKWWVKSQIYLAFSPKNLSIKLIKELVIHGIKSHDNDVAIASALIIGIHGIDVPIGKTQDINVYAINLLKEFGLVERSRAKQCGITTSLKKLMRSVPGINWEKYFSKEYLNVERHIIHSLGYAATDASAWVNSLDVFNDYLLFGLYNSDKQLGNYVLGQTKIGVIINAPPSCLSRKYPNVLKYIKDVHKQRYASRLSHSRIGKTSKPTQKIKFNYIKRSLSMLKNALDDIYKNI